MRPTSRTLMRYGSAGLLLAGLAWGTAPVEAKPGRPKAPPPPPPTAPGPPPPREPAPPPPPGERPTPPREPAPPPPPPPGERPAPPPRERPAPPPHESVTVSGTVNAWRFNRHGHLDGLYLSDGTEVRFPPHLGGSVDAILDLGSPVQVSGERHVKPDGRVHISARTLTNSATGQSVTVR